jgi:uncharacterized protein (TIGR00297 family)
MESLLRTLGTPPLWLALLLSAGFAGLALRLRWLSKSGAVATAVVGFVAYGLGNATFLVPLLGFFVSSSVLSRVGKERKQLLSDSHDAKGSQRDAGQVWANGGAAVICVLVFYFATHPYAKLPLLKLRTLLMLYLTALATVNADTWATEIGKLGKKPPRLLTTLRPVTPGVSGAISGMGTLGALLGALFIPLLALPFWGLNGAELLVVTWAGFVGSLMDSLLGATLQVQFRDTQTGALTERKRLAGRETTRVRGIHWINNDMVNFIASVAGVVVAWLILYYGIYRYY